MTKRHREALETLRYECSYEDNRVGGDQNFIVWEGRTKSHGVKTRSDLVDAGYAVEGKHRFSGAIGYRITAAGLSALEALRNPKH